MNPPQPGMTTIAFLTTAQPAGYDITYKPYPADTVPAGLIGGWPVTPEPLPVTIGEADALLQADGYTRRGDWAGADGRVWACTVRYLDPHADMTERCVAAPAAVNVAVAALRATGNGGRLLAAIPVCFPGRRRNWWSTDQEVITVHGTVFIGWNGTPPAGSPYPDYSQARDRASEAARAHLNGQPGTAGWATVYAEGDSHVTEDVL